MKKQRFNLNLIDILLKLNIVVYENQKQDQKHKLQLNFDRLISYIVMYITIESKSKSKSNRETINRPDT